MVVKILKHLGLKKTLLQPYSKLHCNHLFLIVASVSKPSGATAGQTADTIMCSCYCQARYAVDTMAVTIRCR